MSSRSPSWYADVPTRTTPAPPPRGSGRGSCTAVDASNGLRCRLPAHAGDNHAHERGRFTRTAAPGQVSFPKVEELLAHATARVDAGLEDAGLRHGETEMRSPRRVAWRREQDRLRKARQAAPAGQELVHG